jgi:F-type H+-transporting ATPase subunit b
VEFEWTTALLEAVNFLVLVWLLKRFLYRPILAVVDRRRAESEKVLVDAEARRREAEALKTEYEARLTEAARQRDLALARLDEEIAAERTRRLDAVIAEADADRQRRQTLAARDAGEREAALERQAMAVAARFAGRLLDRLAGPELEAKLVDLMLDDLAAATPDRLEIMRAALQEAGANVDVASAHPLDDARRSAIATALAGIAGRPLQPAFRQDSALTAGLRISAGSWVLMANLRDELAFFSEPVEHGG